MAPTAFRSSRVPPKPCHRNGNRTVKWSPAFANNSPAVVPGKTHTWWSLHSAALARTPIGPHPETLGIWNIIARPADLPVARVSVCMRVLLQSPLRPTQAGQSEYRRLMECGFKTTKDRWSTDGITILSTSFDTPHSCQEYDETLLDFRLLIQLHEQQACR